MDYAFDAPPVDRELLDFAVRLAGRAGQMSAQAFFRDDLHSRLKEDGTEVTEVDLAVEELIRNELSRQAPDDGIFGEEGGSISGSSGRRWIIDPINGTTYFTHRVPLFPDLRSGRRAKLTERSSLGGARTLMHNPAGWPEELLCALHRRVLLLPSTGMIVALVTGRADAGIIAGPPMGYEDVAPMPVIVTEAGGRVTDLRGAPVLEGDMSVLVTNGRLHEGFLQLVEGLPHSRDYRALDDGE
ncbi:inositol monophosphatase family protein [Streptomyces sp. SLBN-31]|jgi:histidinol-phosphatase|uniref:inositol monophosphatase family protein n=1 Tax=Streptomyces sp. SLBN-31 TaxID=2768444 RepID=UPI0011528B0C|nr:inositol monophosphatase family protein [Streptomyces sp. SLBN-31]TQJ85469.1 histidinol-phosphatase [Streptomyces sp. SLBN-31]